MEKLNYYTTSLPGGWVDSPYNQNLIAVGGKEPYIWSHTGSLPDGLTLSSDGLISGVPTTAGTSAFTAQVSDQTGSSTLKPLSIYIGQSIGEAVDNTSLIWTTGGDANWFGENLVYYYDNDAAQTGDIIDGQSSYIQTTVTGTGILSFYWKISSEANYDFLYFCIDNIYQGWISGEVDWKKKSYAVDSGTHTIKWLYEKDGSKSKGSDCGWLDKVEFTPGILSSIIYVSTTGNDDNTGGNPNFPKRTIQGGIDVCPSEGTVSVAGGTYNEAVYINKGIALIGVGTPAITTKGVSNAAIVTFKGTATNNALISGFRITEATGYGIYCNNAFPTITNNTISGNGNDGIHCYYYSSSPKIYNNIITENGTTSTSYYGIYIYSGAPAINYNNVWGNGLSGNNNYYNCTPGPNDISSDPQFISPSDFHLGSSSPCIDKGTNTAPAIPATDKDGKPRIINGIVDIGVYEYQGNPATFTLSANPNTVSADNGISTIIGTLTDRNGNLWDGIVVYWTTNGGMITATSTTTNGIATATFTGTRTGIYTITGTVTDGIFATCTITITQGEPITIEKFLGDNQVGTVTMILSPFVIKLTDTFGNSVGSYTVSWAIATPTYGAELSATSSITSVDGITAVTFTFGTKLGTYQVIVSANPTAMFTATATPGTPTTIEKLAGDTQISTVTTTLNPFVIKLTDMFGNTIGSHTINWAIATPTYSAELSATSSITNDAGTTAVTLTLGTKTGTYIVIVETDLTTTFTAVATCPTGTITGYVILDLPRIEMYTGILVTIAGLPSGTATTDIMGYFIISNVPATELYGTITAYIPGASPRIWKDIIVPPDEVIMLPTLILLNGDANGDFKIDEDDFSMLQQAFFKQIGSEDYKVEVDFNGDGYIDTIDFNYLRINFSSSISPTYIE